MDITRKVGESRGRRAFRREQRSLEAVLGRVGTHAARAELETLWAVRQ